MKHNIPIFVAIIVAGFISGNALAYDGEGFSLQLSDNVEITRKTAFDFDVYEIKEKNTALSLMSFYVGNFADFTPRNKKLILQEFVEATKEGCVWLYRDYEDTKKLQSREVLITCPKIQFPAQLHASYWDLTDDQAEKANNLIKSFTLKETTDGL